VRFVYVLFCIIGWSWAAIVAALLLYLSSKRTPERHGFDVVLASKDKDLSLKREPRPPGNAGSPRSRKEA
jgi:hypothetical protein